LPFAVAQGRRIVRGSPFDAIYSTMTAVTSHFVAYLLSREFALPWVADFQDPWTGYSRFPSRGHEAVARILERRILTAADRVTVTTAHHKRWLLDGFQGLPEHKVEVIPIGFDPAIFEGLERRVEPGFVITHFGTFYATRSPESFLRAVARALAAQPALARDLKVRFVGHFDARMLDLTEQIRDELGLQRTIHLEGIVPYRLGLQILLGSSLLLLVGDNGFWGKVMSSAKLAEYLGANRPILALVPEGSIAGTIRRAHAGAVVEPDDVEGITAAILRAYDLWARGRLTSEADDEFVRSLSWSQLTAKLASVLEDIVSPAPMGVAGIARSATDSSVQ
jgi:glycosyltransferase involved in cell wall biosynthesis